MRIGIVMIMLVLAAEAAFATSIGTGIGVDIQTEDFVPQIWLCDSRSMVDDNIQYWRTTPRCDKAVNGNQQCGINSLGERINNYAFEGEQIVWEVLVMDKNGVNKMKDVFVSIGPERDARKMVPYQYIDQDCVYDCKDICDDCEYDCVQNSTSHGDPCTTCSGGIWLGECKDDCQESKGTCEKTCVRNGMRLSENEIQANCDRIGYITSKDQIPESCNARILEEELHYVSDNVAAMYRCTLTVETPMSMYGEYFVTLEVEDLDGLYNHADEVEYWFFNPVIALLVDGTLNFDEVRPGTSSYSDSILVGNDADEDSGVLLDMFMTGTDFYDSQSSGAMCPTTNQLSLESFRYYTVNGGYSTKADPRSDAEGYVGIRYGDHFDKSLYDYAEILQAGQDVYSSGYGYQANVLTPGSEMPITFRLDLPEPCNGDFDTGAIYFWGEAI